jgi:hypothetical protein
MIRLGEPHAWHLLAHARSGTNVSDILMERNSEPCRVTGLALPLRRGSRASSLHPAGAVDAGEPVAASRVSDALHAFRARAIVKLPSEGSAGPIVTATHTLGSRPALGQRQAEQAEDQLSRYSWHDAEGRSEPEAPAYRCRRCDARGSDWFVRGAGRTSSKARASQQKAILVVSRQ